MGGRANAHRSFSLSFNTIGHVHRYVILQLGFLKINVISWSSFHTTPYRVNVFFFLMATDISYKTWYARASINLPSPLLVGVRF